MESHNKKYLRETTGSVLPYMFLVFACIFFCWFFVLRLGIFGSRVDWVNQHSVLPDYFRKRFYETGNLLPDFAWNLGGGQNVYHLSYYGIFNPVILLSYLLPFLRMDDYIMGSSILCYMVSVFLFYAFLKRKEIPGCICFGTALFFSLSSPLIYHSYNQLMFVNYMPFLCLSLLGTDDYLLRQKRGWLLCGVTGMILTSFYFSIGGMAGLCLYAVSEYLRGTEKVKFFPLLKKGMGYTGILLHGVLLAGILLVPTAISVFSSRQDNVKAEQVMGFLSFAPLKILYTPYGMGLSMLAVVAVLGGILCASEWRERVLPAGLFLIFAVPAVGFLLNGGLYDKGKVFIPFVPLVCLECARYVHRSLKQGLTYKQFLPWFFAGLLLGYAGGLSEFKNYMILAWLDFGTAFLCFLISVCMIIFISAKRQDAIFRISVMIIFFPACLCLFCFGKGMNEERERMYRKEEYQETVRSQNDDTVKRVLDNDESFYRMERLGGDTANHNNMNRIADIRQNITSLYSSCFNTDYWNFRKNIFALNEPLRNSMMQPVTDNPCFLQLMGVKYLLADRQPAGYVPDGEQQVYRNPSAAPVLYVTNQTIGEKEYRKFAFPANQTALMWTAVAGKKGEKGIADKIGGADSEEGNRGIGKMPQMSDCGFVIPECDTAEIMVKKFADGYEIKVRSEVKLQAQLTPKKGAGKHNLFALAFDVINDKPGSDMYIRVNGQTNKLTSVYHEYANRNTDFTYMTTRDAGEDKVSITFGAGSYRIVGIRAFTGKFDELLNPELYQNPVTVAPDQKLDNQLTGSVDVAEDGCLITSIPYDDNFTISVDGKKTESFKVNTAFLGAKIPAGEHEITLTYHAPGRKAGIALSLAGVLLLIYGGFRHFFGRLYKIY